jgi:hypothetical protein
MPDLIPERQELPPESAAPGTAFDPSRPNVARLYDYLLDEDRPAQLIGELVDALPPGSYVFIHHLLDGADPATEQLQGQMLKALGRVKFRTLPEVRALFGDLQLVDPGLVTVTSWRPDPGTVIPAEHEAVLSMACAGVARKA